MDGVIQVLEKETMIDYWRSMNDLILRDLVRKTPTEFKFIHPPPVKKRRIPWKGEHYFELLLLPWHYYHIACNVIKDFGFVQQFTEACLHTYEISDCKIPFNLWHWIVISFFSNRYGIRSFLIIL